MSQKARPSATKGRVPGGASESLLRAIRHGARGALMGAVVSAGVPGCRCEPERTEPCPPAASGDAVDAGSAAQAPLSAELKEARNPRSAVFMAPSRLELEDYGTWLGAVANAAWSSRLPDCTAPAGFMGRTGDSGRVWLLQEQTTKKRGAGLVAIRPETHSRLMIQAPHSFFDAGTLEIALRVFDETEARVLLVNTMHRGGEGDPDTRRAAVETGESASDVAHNAKTFFSAAHETLTTLEPNLRTLQIHGFADERAPGVKAIVSAADSTADGRGIANVLSGVFGATAVRLYPDEIDILGGTTNAQARTSRQLGAAFVHLELSASARAALRDDPELRRSFADALRGALGGPR